MQELIEEFINRRVWAVVGASQNPAKYGYKIVQDLTAAGYKVYPVNPKGGEIEGIQVYRSLRELPEKPEVVDIVVPPQVTEEVVKECRELGLTRIWMQPGAESEAAIRYCEENGMQVVYGVCAMLNKKRWEE
ncbi:MAG: CoA-binding protein [Chloroflexi bacterium]|nr:MAG: CoA-binding protein [Chloroflexota bacterium]HDN79366.1 CoA-binding protein [Chloroflexota bacterium]